MHVHISHQQHLAVKEKSQSNRASLHLVAHRASEPKQLVCFSYSRLFSYIFKKRKEMSKHVFTASKHTKPLAMGMFTSWKTDFYLKN